MGRSTHKTKLSHEDEREMKRFARTRGQVAGIPVVLKPVVVPVPLSTIEIQIQDVAVAVRVTQDCMKCPPRHHPLNTLGVVSYSIF